MKSRKSIAALLMDQSVVAGVGNIYRAELLFRARVSPFVAGKDLEKKVLKAIWKDVVLLMRAGMIDRRIITTHPKDRPSRATSSRGRSAGKVLTNESDAKVPEEEAHYVYRRHGQECFVCGTKVAEGRDGGEEPLLVPHMSRRCSQSGKNVVGSMVVHLECFVMRNASKAGEGESNHQAHRRVAAGRRSASAR